MSGRPSKKASQALAFFRKLKVPTGRLAGKPVKLGKFQREFIIGSLKPGISIAALCIARGQGKTALSAGIALGYLMGEIDPQPKPGITFAARNRDQARHAFDFLVGYIQTSFDEAEQDNFIIRRGSKLEVEYVPNGGLARCIASDGKTHLGGADTCAIMDERAAWPADKGDELENAILSGLGKRDGIALMISTPGPDDANSFSRWIDSPPEGTYVQSHQPEPGLPADDLESLMIANPGSREGIGPTPECLQEAARRAIARGGSALTSFRNLNRCERVSTESGAVFLTIDEWMNCEVSPEDLPERDGICIAGSDLGGSRSQSAMVFYWPKTGRAEAYAAFGGKPSLLDRGQADGVGDRYQKMEDRGELMTMGELVVPPAEWLQRMMAKLDGYPVACIVGDRFREGEFRDALRAAKLDRVPFIPRGNGYRDGGEDCERCRTLIFDGKVKMVPSLLMRSAMSEAIVVIDDSGNSKLSKKRSLGRIDAVSALVVATAEGARRMAVPERGPVRIAWA